MGRPLNGQPDLPSHSRIPEQEMQQATGFTDLCLPFLDLSCIVKAT